MLADQDAVGATVTTTAGRAVVDVLRAEGVDAVFGLPGGHVLDIYEGLYDAPDIRHVLVRHEHAAAAMAAGYAQMTGRPGVCVATAGPGATNLLTAVAEAHVGCLPMIVLAGRGMSTTTHRGASQEIATDRMFAPVTKWSVRVDRAELVPDAVRQAFAIARGGRPGPVYVEVPRDVLGEEITYAVAPPAPATPARVGGDADAVDALADRLLGAAHPLLIAGGGTIASAAWEELRELAELLAAPVLTSLSGRGAIPDDHPLSAGGLGVHRNRLAKRLLVEGDVVVGLGTRFEEMETNWKPGRIPSPEACYAQVDIDPGELGRGVPAHIAIVGDVRTVLRQLLGALRERGAAAPADLLAHPRVADVVAEVAAIDADIDALVTQPTSPVHPLTAIRAARDAFPRDSSVGFDVGALAQHIAGGFPFFRVYEPRSLIVPSSFYGMGFVAAALPVAAIVRPGRPVVGFVGDGSFQMVMNILPVAAEERLGVTWVVLDDGALGSIRDIQELRLDGRIIGTEFAVQPDFAAVAEACGCRGERVERSEDLAGALTRALEANQDGVPAVVAVTVAPERLLQSREHSPFFPIDPEARL
jgi:acetolactate synthase-1/2/3 large subunit